METFTSASPLSSFPSPGHWRSEDEARRARGRKGEEKGKERNITHRHYGVVTTSPLILLLERDAGVERERREGRREGKGEGWVGGKEGREWRGMGRRERKEGARSREGMPPPPPPLLYLP